MLIIQAFHRTLFAELMRLSCFLYYCKQFISNNFTGLGGINLSSKLSQAENVDLVLLITGLLGGDMLLEQHLHQQELRRAPEPQCHYPPQAPAGDRDRQAPPCHNWLTNSICNWKWTGV